MTNQEQDEPAVPRAVDAVVVPPRPFLKWVGGKTSLLPELLKRVPAEIPNYFEPFVGAGALFWALRSRVSGRVLISDANAELCAAYRGVRDNVDGVVKELRHYETKHGKDWYLWIRQLDYRGETDAFTGARMIYLNKTGFNGLYRVNAHGNFNVPFGKQPKFTCDEVNLRNCSAALQGVEVACCDYRKSLLQAEKGDFVYLDPPYIPLTKTSNFTSYTAGKFDMSDQERLAREVRKLRYRGVGFLLTNAGCADTERLYNAKNFKLEKVASRRRVSCKGSLRTDAADYVIS
jgi:DNA adenine methylase